MNRGSIYPSVKSSRTSSHNSEESTEGNTDEYLTLSLVKSPKTITICTLCGRYKGIRMRRYIFIILCIALVLLILLLGLIILLYAIIPAIVRSTIAKAELGFRSVNIVQIENDRFRLRAQLELKHTGSIPATILSPLIINVDNVGTVINNDPIVITGDSSGSSLAPIDAPFIVSNMEGFYDFSRALIFESKVVWHLKAEATVRPISRFMLSYSKIPLNKEITLNALNGLTNVSIDTVSLNRSDANQVLVDIIININNPSMFSIDLGESIIDIIFEILYK
jgi:hypothetical protein